MLMLFVDPPDLVRAPRIMWLIPLEANLFFFGLGGSGWELGLPMIAKVVLSLSPEKVFRTESDATDVAAVQHDISLIASESSGS
jgi:hypothetical protein